MIERADRNPNNRGRTSDITEDQITHRMIDSPDVKKIQDKLKAKDSAKKPKAVEKKDNSDGELHE